MNSCKHVNSTKSLPLSYLVPTAIAGLGVSIGLAVATAVAVSIAACSAVRLVEQRQQLAQRFQILHHQSCREDKE